MPISDFNNPDRLADQYKDSGNLNTRINLHQRFSSNQYGWHTWIFDHFDILSTGRILELGCGQGDLWLENIERISSGSEQAGRIV